MTDWFGREQSEGRSRLYPVMFIAVKSKSRQRGHRFFKKVCIKLYKGFDITSCIDESMMVLEVAGSKDLQMPQHAASVKARVGFFGVFDYAKE